MSAVALTQKMQTSAQGLRTMARQLKEEIKRWEKEYERDQGRKPEKKDVYDDTDIHDMYKLYNKVKSMIKDAPNDKSPQGEDVSIQSAQTSAGVDTTGNSVSVAEPNYTTIDPKVDLEQITVNDDMSVMASTAETAETDTRGSAASPVRPGTASSRLDALRKHQKSARERRVEVGKITSSEPNPSTARSPTKSMAIFTSLRGQTGDFVETPSSPHVSLHSTATTTMPSTSPLLSDVLQRASSDMQLIQPTVTQAAITPIFIPVLLDDVRSTPAEQGLMIPRQRLLDKDTPLDKPITTKAIRNENGELQVEGGGYSEIDKTTWSDERKEVSTPLSTKIEMNSTNTGMSTQAGETLAANVDILEPIPSNHIFRGTIYRSKIPTKATVLLTLINEADNKTILSVRREINLKLRPTYYIFEDSHAADLSKDLAKWRVRGKADGSQWNVIETGSEKTIALIHYLSATIPRAMMVAYCPPGKYISPEIQQMLQFNGYDVQKLSSGTDVTVLKNRMPKFNDMLKTYCLNFGGRVTLPSVKNFQLMRTEEEPTYVQFGRIGKETFTMDIRSPLYPLVAFAISISTFDAIEKV